MTVKEVLKSLLFHADEPGEEWQDDAIVKLDSLDGSGDGDFEIYASIALKLLSEGYLCREVEHIQAIKDVVHISICRNEGEDTTE